MCCIDNMSTHNTPQNIFTNLPGPIGSNTPTASGTHTPAPQSAEPHNPRPDPFARFCDPYVHLTNNFSGTSLDKNIFVQRAAQNINPTRTGLSHKQLRVLYTLIRNTIEYAVQTSEQILWGYLINMANHINNNFIRAQDRNADLANMVGTLQREVDAMGPALSTNITQNDVHKLAIQLLQGSPRGGGLEGRRDIKLSDPPIFSGENSQTKIKDWIEGMGLYFSAADIPDDDTKVILGLMCIRGETSKLITEYRREALQPKAQRNLNWDQFTTKLMSVYGQVDERESAVKEIGEL